MFDLQGFDAFCYCIWQRERDSNFLRNRYIINSLTPSLTTNATNDAIYLKLLKSCKLIDCLHQLSKYSFQ